MIEIRSRSEPAPGATANLDVCVAVDGLVAVLDGVTEMPGLGTGCRHGTAWYTRRLAARLTQAYLQLAGSALTEVLASAIEAVRADHGGQCDLDRPNTPAAAVAVLRADGDHADYLLLCDATIVLDIGGSVTTVTDNRLAVTIDRLRTEPQPVGLDRDALWRRHAVAKWPHVNTADGYWIAAAAPEAAAHALTGTAGIGGPGGLRRAALLTDGAARAVDVFGFADWPGLLTQLESHGPGHLIRQVRQAEYRAGQDRASPVRKAHDDATAAFCAFTALSAVTATHGEETT
jgi:hypothetical protein